MSVPRVPLLLVLSTLSLLLHHVVLLASADGKASEVNHYEELLNAYLVNLGRSAVPGDSRISLDLGSFAVKYAVGKSPVRSFPAALGLRFGAANNSLNNEIVYGEFMGVPRSALGEEAEALKTRPNAIVVGLSGLADERLVERICEAQSDQSRLFYGQFDGTEGDDSAERLWIAASPHVYSAEQVCDVRIVWGAKRQLIDGSACLQVPKAWNTSAIQATASAALDVYTLGEQATAVELLALALAHLRRSINSTSTISQGRSKPLSLPSRMIISAVPLSTNADRMVLARAAAVMAGFDDLVYVPDVVAWAFADAVGFRGLALPENEWVARESPIPGSQKESEELLLVIDAGHSGTRMAAFVSSRLADQPESADPRPGAARAKIHLVSSREVLSFSGERFDQALADYFMMRSGAQNAVDALLAVHDGSSARQIARLRERVLAEALRVKEVLSANKNTIAVVDLADFLPADSKAGSGRFKLEISREDFVSLPFFSAGRSDFENALSGLVSAARTHTSSDTLVRVMLVGGISRVPEIRSLVSAATGITEEQLARQHTNADEGAAAGAEAFIRLATGSRPVIEFSSLFGVSDSADTSSYAQFLIAASSTDSPSCYDPTRIAQGAKRVAQQIERNSVLADLERMHSDLESMIFESRDYLEKQDFSKATPESERARADLSTAVALAEERIDALEEGGGIESFARSDGSLQTAYVELKREVDALRSQTHKLFGELKEIERLNNVVEMCDSFVPKMRSRVRKWADKAGRNNRSVQRAVERIEDSLAGLAIWVSQLKPLIDSGESLIWLPSPDGSDTNERLTPSTATKELRRLMDAVRADFAAAQKESRVAAERESRKKSFMNFSVVNYVVFAVLASAAAFGAFYIRRHFQRRARPGSRQAQRREVLQARKAFFKAQKTKDI